LACPWTVQGEKADAAIEKRCVRLGQIFLPTIETTDCEDDRYRAFHRRGEPQVADYLLSFEGYVHDLHRWD